MDEDTQHQDKLVTKDVVIGLAILVISILFLIAAYTFASFAEPDPSLHTVGMR